MRADHIRATRGSMAVGPSGRGARRPGVGSPPAELTARLLLGRARALARQQREQDAEAAYQEVLRRFPRSYAAPEAAYWQAVCRYKWTHQPNDLLGGWRRTLHTRYPGSQWRTAQSWSEPPLRD